MSLKVCISTPDTLMYPQGGHLWVFINWALGLQSCGCEITWLDIAPSDLEPDRLVAMYERLRKTLSPFGLDTHLAIESCSSNGTRGGLCQNVVPGLESFGAFDLLIDFRYDLPSRLLSRFRRKVLINIDPGLFEMALAGGAYPEPEHDLVFSIGELTSQSTKNIHWLYTTPCVFLDEWPFTWGSSDLPWTTIAHWWGADPKDQDNSKRESFRPFMTLPSKVRARFELALNVDYQQEQARIESYGFKVYDAHKTVASPGQYRTFIQNSAAEFSCAKPIYVKLQTSWLSDRTLCYLASGKPCVVQNTGPSVYLPNDKGLHRFCNLDEAIKSINSVIDNYETEAQLARSLAQEFFDARKVAAALLARAL